MPSSEPSTQNPYTDVSSIHIFPEDKNSPLNQNDILQNKIASSSFFFKNSNTGEAGFSILKKTTKKKNRTNKSVGKVSIYYKQTQQAFKTCILTPPSLGGRQVNKLLQWPSD